MFLFFFYVFVAIAFFLIAMEEISWGQRIFGWETPEFLTQVNEQNEISIHNIGFLSSLFEVFALGTSLMFVPVLFSLLLELKGNASNNYSFYLPHYSLFFLSLLVGFVAFTFQGELLEELIALFSLIYSFKILRFLSLKRQTA